MRKVFKMKIKNQKQVSFRKDFKAGVKACKKGKLCLSRKRGFIAGYAYQYEREVRL